jgi:flagellar assembly protein FliH
MATIIKATNADCRTHGTPFHFDDMSIKAIDTVRGQATEIIAAAHREAEAIRRQATVDGEQTAFQSANAAMQEKLEERLATLLPAFGAALKDLEQAKSACLMQCERATIELAKRIAERVVRRELKRDPQISLVWIKEALELAAGSAEVQLRMHPDDVDALGRDVENFTRELSRDGTVKIIGDPSITLGGCRVETKFGVIDQQLESQLARIVEDLT